MPPSTSFSQILGQHLDKRAITQIQALSRLRVHEREAGIGEDWSTWPAEYEACTLPLHKTLCGGGGTVESGVNTVAHHRMKRQGRGWKRLHAQAMLAALSELHSGRFQAAWRTVSLA